jgi:hypothetical protein
MTRKFLTLSSFASLALALPAFANGNSGAGVDPVPGSMRATVVCRDVQSVPVTADAAQTLPMQLVTRLNCGAEVVLLSDSDSYTVNVRTPDGQTGYVAHMYLSEFTASTPEAVQSAVSENGIARWKSGTVGSDQFYSDGMLVESLTANGVTVQVALQDTGWKMRASVAIANGSSQNARFNPKGFTLDELTPHLRNLVYQNPKDLAKAPTHEVYWTMTTATPPAASMVAASYKGSANVITTNYLAQPQDAQTQAPILEAHTLAPKEKTAGVVWFERDKNAQQLTLRIFVNEQIFEFPLSFPQH